LKTYRYYDFVMAAFVTVLICSNFIGAAKQTTIDLPLLGATTFSAGVLFFPISYIFGDILTEVYGYGRDRRVVWAGFAGLAFATFMAWVVISLPPAGSDFMKSYQANLEGVFGNSWRIALGSMIAFWCGSFANSYTLAKMKIRTQGRWLWSRTIGSTLVGQGLDSLVFIVLAFAGNIPTSVMLAAVVTQWIFKSAYEVLATPLTYLVVNRLKRAEGLDVYDRDTSFNPLLIGR
jgi:uncharacterized integral membrane protein (TIGR00697 family)